MVGNTGGEVPPVQAGLKVTMRENGAPVRFGTLIRIETEGGNYTRFTDANGQADFSSSNPVRGEDAWYDASYGNDNVDDWTFLGSFRFLGDTTYNATYDISTTLPVNDDGEPSSDTYGDTNPAPGTGTQEIVDAGNPVWLPPWRQMNIPSWVWVLLLLAVVIYFWRSE